MGQLILCRLGLVIQWCGVALHAGGIELLKGKVDELYVPEIAVHIQQCSPLHRVHRITAPQVCDDPCWTGTEEKERVLELTPELSHSHSLKTLNIFFFLNVYFERSVPFTPATQGALHPLGSSIIPDWKLQHKAVVRNSSFGLGHTLCTTSLVSPSRA